MEKKRFTIEHFKTPIGNEYHIVELKSGCRYAIAYTPMTAELICKELNKTFGV